MVYKDLSPEDKKDMQIQFFFFVTFFFGVFVYVSLTSFLDMKEALAAAIFFFLFWVLTMIYIVKYNIIPLFPKTLRHPFRYRIVENKKQDVIIFSIIFATIIAFFAYLSYI